MEFARTDRRVFRADCSRRGERRIVCIGLETAKDREALNC